MPSMFVFPLHQIPQNVSRKKSQSDNFKALHPEMSMLNSLGTNDDDTPLSLCTYVYFIIMANYLPRNM